MGIYIVLEKEKSKFLANKLAEWNAMLGIKFIISAKYTTTSSKKMVVSEEDKELSAFSKQPVINIFSTIDPETGKISLHKIEKIIIELEKTQMDIAFDLLSIEGSNKYRSPEDLRKSSIYL